jgi:hypothetical protein
MMDCEAIKRSLGTWLDGEIGLLEGEAIQRHLEVCPSCVGEKTRLERLETALKSVLEERASGVAFEPFWGGVRRRIQEKGSWHVRLLDWATPAFSSQRLAWAVPLIIILLLGLFSLEDFFPGWIWGPGKSNLTAVESIDSHGFNVALFRESNTKTIVIWLFQDEEEEESSGKSAAGEPSF